MQKETFVYVDLAGATHQIGRLCTCVDQGRESASFHYDDAWIDHPECFALGPALAPVSGAHNMLAGKALYGAVGDSAPDRWGRWLMARAEQLTARAEERSPRTLTELDYLLNVSDRARQGAVRFSAEPGGPFLAQTGADPVPPLIELPRLLAASDRIDGEEDNDEFLASLLAPGSSVGGERPKVSVLDIDGKLAIAKLPKRDDKLDIVRWEAVALSLAAHAGIQVPSWRIERLGDRYVLIVRRFDRNGEERIPFLSAMGMLGADDSDTRSYLEIVDALRQHGAEFRADREALWKRIVFSILISNTDDHSRNHGFLYAGTAGWRLSPAYDLNPVPADLKPRFLSMAVNLNDHEASLELALNAAPYFDIDENTARAVAKNIALSVAEWRTVAAKIGLPRPAIERMASAFEHDDLKSALNC